MLGLGIEKPKLEEKVVESPVKSSSESSKQNNDFDEGPTFAGSIHENKQ